MARKNILQGLMDGASDPVSPVARVDPAKPRYSTGAIGAVSQSIAELKSRSISDMDADLIDAGGMRDRLEEAGDSIAKLAESIRDYGQQVPVLVRPHPKNPDRYQVVYGRRRVAALRSLGLPVKVMIRNLDDRELVIAQGQENAARKDLSFVEKSIFAGQMRDAGYERKIICDALHVDKTLISRMISVSDRVPLPLIEAIGAAPGIGRDRWLTLADLMAQGDHLEAAIGHSAGIEVSDKRFKAVMLGLSANVPKNTDEPPALPAQVLRASDGREVAQIKRRGGKLTVVVNENTAEGFDQWLVDNLQDIHRGWFAGRDV